MQASRKPREQLQRAADCIKDMEASKGVVELEKHWLLFLRELERAWNKAVAHFGKSPKWNGWKGLYEKAREEDELLAYLRRARDADEHTIADISSKFLVRPL